ncbi:MAG: hypothetical protein NT075_37780 [Chloroflexi bacterium]|nr:hypothetical protein [Chloroflexota bacterium]
MSLRTRTLRLIGVVLALLIVCGCTQPPSTPPPATALPALPFATDPPAEALPHLIIAERQASIAKDLGLLTQLWAEDSRIVDGRGTPDPADDYRWEGRAAILDRYEVAVFANPPPPLEKVDDLTLQVTGTTAIGRRGQDRWRFVQRNGRWWLAELRYSQP